MSDSLPPRELQHARLPSPSPTPGAYSNSCPSSLWCHPTILSSVIPLSCLQSFLASRSFPVSQLFTSGSLNTRASASASVLPINIKGWFPLGLTGLTSLQPKGLWRVFSNTPALSLLYGPTLTSIRRKRPWWWKRLKVGRERDDRGWDVWMASPSQWTWVWASSGTWWRTGKPGMLPSMGSERMRRDWATKQPPQQRISQAFQGAPVVRHLPASTGRGNRCGLDPWVRKIPWRSTRQPTSVLLPGEFHGQRSLVDYST